MSFDRHISLGTHCYTSWLLKRAGLRTDAYPFDWLYSDAGMISEMIQDRFLAFLDKSAYIRLQRGKYTVFGHSAYSIQFNRPIIFNHHNPLQDSDYEQFVRRCARFIDDTASGRSHFLMVTEPDRFGDVKAAQLEAALDSVSPDYVADIITTRQAVGDEAIGIEPAFGTTKLRVWRHLSKSLMQGGLSFADEGDNQSLESILLLRTGRR